MSLIFHNSEDIKRTRIGDNFKLARDLRQLSQTEFAELSGISVHQISQIENGEYNIGSNEELFQKLASALNYPLSFFANDWQDEDLVVINDHFWSRKQLKYVGYNIED